jgi:ATP-binding cassette subfamily C exporter for protease/lipase
LHLPKGYETLLDDGGVGLSGGQIQRVAMAQALYDDPCLIILDEPNSNLDQVGEAAFVDTLAKLKAAGQTVVYITHSLHLIRHSDKLLLLENGVIKAFDVSQKVIEQLSAKSASLSGPMQ